MSTPAPLPSTTNRLLARARDLGALYWTLVRIIVPVMVAAEVLVRTGAVAAVAPVLSPVMSLYGLPADLGLAWLTGMLVGVWAGVLVVFTLVPASSLTVADMTVFATLVLFAHALPVEQQIIRQAGPRMTVTTLLRIGGGMLYAAVLHQLFAATGWLSAPLAPAWMPMGEATGWAGFFAGLVETLAGMLAILVALVLLLDGLKATGLMDRLMRLVDPLLRLADIRGDARQLAAIGVLLGVSYGAGLLIREARSGRIPPRQVFNACIFMGFGHSLIEDTLLFVALGADPWSLLAGRLAFGLAATAAVVRTVARVPDRTFFAVLFHPVSRPGGPAQVPAVQGDRTSA